MSAAHVRVKIVRVPDERRRTGVTPLDGSQYEIFLSEQVAAMNVRCAELAHLLAQNVEEVRGAGGGRRPRDVRVQKRDLLDELSKRQRRDAGVRASVQAPGPCTLGLVGR